MKELTIEEVAALSTEELYNWLQTIKDGFYEADTVRDLVGSAFIMGLKKGRQENETKTHLRIPTTA